MINISFDMGNAPSVLAAMADPRLKDKLVKVGAETYVDEMLDWIDQGKAFEINSETNLGILQESIGWRFAGNGVAEIYANAEYAGYVEHGTGIHIGHTSWEITPKAGRKALKIPSGNGYFFSGKVIHPGSKPHPFFFADQQNRKDNMQTEMISVLAAFMDDANG